MQPMVLVYKNLHDWGVLFGKMLVNICKYSSTMVCIFLYNPHYIEDIPSGKRLHNYRKSTHFSSFFIHSKMAMGHGFKFANCLDVYQAGYHPPYWIMIIYWIYPLVNVYIAIENHHF